MEALSVFVTSLKSPEQLRFEAEEDEIQEAARAREKHAAMQEEERKRRISELQIKQAAKKALEEDGNGDDGSKLPVNMPDYDEAGRSLLKRAAAIATSRIVAVMYSHDDLLALTVVEVIRSSRKTVRREALDKIDKVVTAADGNLMMVIRESEPMLVESSKFSMNELGSFFQFLSEFREKATRKRREEQEEHSRRVEREKALKQGRMAEEEKRAAEREQRVVEERRSTLRARMNHPNESRLLKEVFGEDCVFAVDDVDVYFASSNVSQSAAIKDIKSVKNDPDGNILFMSEDNSKNLSQVSISIPGSAFSLEQLEQVFKIMKGFADAMAREQRDRQQRLEEERLSREREAREAAEAEAKRRLQEEEQRKAEEERRKEEEKRQAELDKQARKDRKEKQIRDAAKKAKDPIVMLLHGPSSILACSSKTFYVMVCDYLALLFADTQLQEGDQDLRTTSLKDIQKVAMGKDPNSMAIFVAGDPFVEISVTDYPMDQLGAFFQKLSK
eukprot:767520-Hanusia_phi.AAC.1